MILGSHIVFGAYGFWLPNDPRGSWSEYVGSRKLYRFGPATKTQTRRSVAAAPHDAAARRAARSALERPPVRLSGAQAQSVGVGFGDFVRRSGLVVWACAILPDHVHVVVARHRYRAEQAANLLKGAATRRLVADRRHPCADLADGDGPPPKCWAQGAWTVFLDSEADVMRATAYVEDNPITDGLPRQRWSFVTPFLPAPV
jgi:REP element-mobilizing transposase RayT